MTQLIGVTGAQRSKRTRLAREPAGFAAIAGSRKEATQCFLAEMCRRKEEEGKDDASVFFRYEV